MAARTPKAGRSVIFWQGYGRSPRVGFRPSAARIVESEPHVPGKKKPRIAPGLSLRAGRLFFIENPHRRIENGRIVEGDDAAVGALLEMHTHALLGLGMPPSELVTDSFDRDTQFICNTLGAPARQSVLDATQLVECNNHIGMF